VTLRSDCASSSVRSSRPDGPAAGRGGHPARVPARARQHGRGRFAEPLSRWTTLGVGGPAERFEQPAGTAELRELVARCRDAGVPWRALGQGSNLVVDDAGVRGVVVHTGSLRGLVVHGPQAGQGGRLVTAGAGLPTAVLLARTRQLGLGGLEALVGYPATVGGAVRMNAGGRYGTTGARVVRVRAVDRDGDLVDLDAEACRFGYRTSSLAACVVTEATFRLPAVDPRGYALALARVQREKAASQPLAERSAGCVFKNPPGTSAGRLVEECGLKGRARGGAVVSEVHGNFVVNRGGATADDVLGLAEEVRAAVERRTGLWLELEVEVWGPGHVPATG
jgi:UDP-N-acetylmuramate dehydrogenase